jgi:hypothetical protein
MKRTPTDDGVFKKETWSAEKDKNGQFKEADIVAIMNALRPEVSAADWITRTREEARKMQEQADLHPDDDDDIQSAVEALLARLNAALDRAETGGDEASRLHAAFNAGAHWRELFIRFASPSIHAGQGTIRGGRDGGEVRKSVARPKYIKIQNAFDEMMERHPNFNKSDCYANLNKAHGWSESTIKRALRSRRKK